MDGGPRVSDVRARCGHTRSRSILPLVDATCLSLLREATRANTPVYPMYVSGTLQAAGQARSSGCPISVVEFGVASGRGLVALEWIAARVHGMTGMAVHVFGFDTGQA